MTDIVASLRELLLERAAGRIDAEEFERRQAALHATVLQDAPPQASVAGATIAASPIPAASAAAAATTATAATRPGRWRFPLMIGVIALAAGIYGWLGAPGEATGPDGSAAMPTGGDAPAAAGDAKNHNGGDLAVLVKRLAEKLEKDPKNGEGWALLAHSYLELRQHKEADAAFAKAAAQLPPSAEMYADWADAHVVANNRQWDAKAGELVKKALAADPKHLKSLALAGSEAFDGKRYKEAIAFWKRMQAAAPADSMDAKLAAANIAEAEAVLSGKPLPAAVAEAANDGGNAGAASGNEATGVSVRGTVSLAPSAKAGVAPGDTVFVFAKSPDNSGPPLAVKRFTVADLPASFSLSDGDAMMPNRTISTFPEVLISARLSKSGNAAPQPGDLNASAQKVRAGSTGVALILKP